MQSLFASEPQLFGVFPENWSPLNLFLKLQTQWQHAGGMGGGMPTGLAYGSVPVVMDLLEVPQEERADHFDALRVLEGEWLKETHKQLKEKANARGR